MSIPDKNWQPPFVSLDTTMGEVVVELYWQHAPITCRLDKLKKRITKDLFSEILLSWPGGVTITTQSSTG